MNRKILLSLGVLVFVAAVTLTATGAFFSDTETSTGNTFTAGALDLKVDDSQHYAGLVCVANIGEVPGSHWVQDLLIGPNPTTRPELIGTPCDGLWSFTDLTPVFNLTHHFFNFSDVKPGDQGENTVSLHVDNNAWACLDIVTTGNNDNSVLVPEVVAGDNASSSAGELAQNVNVFAWLDNGTTTQQLAGDNIYQPLGGDKALFGPVLLSSFIGATTTLTLADGGTGSPLIASTTNYIGLAWCVGSTTVNGTTGAITCDGSVVGNIIQTDSATSTVQFRVEQARNNPNFRCRPPVTAPTTLTLAKAVNPPAVALDSAFTLTASSTLTKIVGTEGQAVVTNALVTPGTYALSEAGGPGGETSKILQCTGNATAAIDNGNGTGSVTIATGENVTCGFTDNFPNP